jgi:enoyl-CoA hydratase/carnithine racemase
MSTPQAEVLSASLQDGVLRLTITREKARNALNDALIDALREQIQAAGRERKARVILITGEGARSFCAGADLKPDSKTFGFDYARPTAPYADLLRAAYACDLPIVGRINGDCLAGGMGVLSICDMAVAASTARFGLPEVKIGMFPMQVASVLQQLIPRRKFVEMCLTGEMITAEQALGFDLVNYVVPPEELDSRTDWLIARIIDKSPTAIRRGKHALRAIADMTFDQSIAFTETQLGTLVLTGDSQEGLAAFNEKRAPKWPGT